MNLPKMFDDQKVVRSKIIETHNLQNHNLFPNLILALQVELGELANETRCFKHWSVKGPSEKEVVIEEYADGMSFILELGIEIEFDNYLSIGIAAPYKNLTEQFTEVFSTISQFEKRKSKLLYSILLEEFLCLGKMLGFTGKEIEQAYYKKRAINLERQNNGY